MNDPTPTPLQKKVEDLIYDRAQQSAPTPIVISKAFINVIVPNAIEYMPSDFYQVDVIKHNLYIKAWP